MTTSHLISRSFPIGFSHYFPINRSTPFWSMSNTRSTRPRSITHARIHICMATLGPRNGCCRCHCSGSDTCRGVHTTFLSFIFYNPHIRSGCHDFTFALPLPTLPLPTLPLPTLPLSLPTLPLPTLPTLPSPTLPSPTLPSPTLPTN